MPQEKENLTKNAKTLKVLLDVLQEDHLSKSDFTKEFKNLVDVLKTQIDALRTEAENNRNELTARAEKTLEDLESKLNEALTKVDKLTKESNEISASDRRTVMRFVNQRMEEMTDLIEYYDDSEVRQLIDDVKSSIPESYDASQIEKDIKELEGKYQELDKKIQRTGNAGGGVSNLRIQQAFKYILKTEQPVGDIDGANTDYTVSQDIFAVLAFSLNGEVIAQLPNYTISGKTISFSEALPSAYSGKDFEIKYI